MDVKYPEVTVKLVGEDGNVFNIVGLTTRALKRAGHPEAAKAFSDQAFECSSYDEVLQLVMRTVEVE